MPSIFERFRIGHSYSAYARPLVDRGHGLIYDVLRDITWLQDANHAKTLGRSPDGQLTWPQAMAFVAGLNYRGVRGWRLPTALDPDGSGPCVGHDCNGGEIGHLLLDVSRTHPGIVNYTNQTVPCIYWTSTEASATEAYAFDVFSLRQGPLLKDPFVQFDGIPAVPLLHPVLAWPVHDGDVAAMIESRWARLIREYVREPFFSRAGRND